MWLRSFLRTTTRQEVIDIATETGFDAKDVERAL
jgi:hypothetical protein